MKKIFCSLILVLITSAYANEKIDVVGTIYYSESLNAFSVFYLKDEKPMSHFIQVKNQDEIEKLKASVGKSIRFEGDLSWKQSNNEVFSLKEELSMNRISDFELKYPNLDGREIVKESAFSKEKQLKSLKFSPSFEISDDTANAIITASTVALGIATGPLILVPLAFLGLSQLFTL